MDHYSSGEELIIKTRKPYTITKQRERWTEEEHNRFLEALKLYGRAWQRIEEHIGTKTAVQIRSHAQKFFTKLEKEALSKGVPVGQTLDIEIPPPRPKRKPSNPYPRKTSVGGTTTEVGGKEGKLSAPVSLSCNGKQILDLEKEPLPEKSSSDGKLENLNECQSHNSEIFNLRQGAPFTSQSSTNKNSMPNVVKPGNPCTFREFMPTLRDSINKDETSKSTVNADDHEGQQKLESDGGNGACKISKFGNEKFSQDKRTDEGNQTGNLGSLPKNQVQTQDYPRHIPIHILDGSLKTGATNITSDISYQESLFQHMGRLHGHVNLYGYPTSSATSEHQSHGTRSSIHQSFPGFHHSFNPTQNQEEYQAFLQASTTFSSLIVSALLQNPAAHAAASFAAAFWPCANLETPSDSNAGRVESFWSQQINATPSMAAMVAATVAAATAWWAAHGLLPLCAPSHTAFTSSPASASTNPMDASQSRAVNSEKREDTLDTVMQDQQLDLECSKALQEQHSASKSPCSSTSDSEECEGVKENTGLVATEAEEAGTVTEQNDKNNLKNRKQVDRSSCGSNTPSSSEVEGDGLEKQEKDKEESKEPDVSRPSSDSSIRRGRSISNTIDSWKEVSEEGRLAFQALFSREVLPQSFSPPQDLKYKAKNLLESKQNSESTIEILQSNPNTKICGSCSSSQVINYTASFRSGIKKEDGLQILGNGHTKLKARQIGFKPYKRCSVEANESRVATTIGQGEEKGPKRIRMDGEAYT